MRANRLADIGHRVGGRILELLTMRERGLKRENKLNGILLFLHTNVWKVRQTRFFCFRTKEKKMCCFDGE